MSTKINNILFDLDGTLADTAPDLAHALNQLLQEQGKPPLALETIRPSVSLGGIVMIRNFLGVDETDQDFSELRQRFLDIYSSNLADKTRLFPGMDQVLNSFESRNIPWGVVTNKPAWLTDPLMRALRLDNRASCIVSGDTVEHSKPHPAPMLHACQLAARDPVQTLYIGDAKPDIMAGHNAGMITLIAGYGYIAGAAIVESYPASVRRCLAYKISKLSPASPVTISTFLLLLIAYT